MYGVVGMWLQFNRSDLCHGTMRCESPSKLAVLWFYRLPSRDSYVANDIRRAGRSSYLHLITDHYRARVRDIIGPRRENQLAPASFFGDILVRVVAKHGYGSTLLSTGMGLTSLGSPCSFPGKEVVAEQDVE
jgi:hypothetical protein